MSTLTGLLVKSMGKRVMKTKERRLPERKVKIRGGEAQARPARERIGDPDPRRPGTKFQGFTEPRKPQTFVGIVNDFRHQGESRFSEGPGSLETGREARKKAVCPPMLGRHTSLIHPHKL